jgi:hypothetical protein
VTFPGDWTTSGRLLDGPCRDFNVLSARGKVRHEVSVLRLGSKPVALPEAATLVAFCARGRVAVDGVELEEEELVVLEATPGAKARSRSEEGGLVVVAFAPVAP